MQAFVSLTARACALPLADVDTDQLIPARFMRRPRSAGYGAFLLYDLRRLANGELDPEFPLNGASAEGAQVLVARSNFGGGSSREAAVYALVDHGFRVVIASSFGDIFSSNAVRNGLLPARVEPAVCEALLAVGDDEAMTVDLRDQSIVTGGRSFTFAIDPAWKLQLLKGWDDVDLALNEAAAIAEFRARDEKARPWARPGAPEGSAQATTRR